MSYMSKNVISGAIRDVLDSRGIEISWSDTDACAEAVRELLEKFLLDREVNIH